MIFIVLESVAARWTSLNGPYDTTTRLKAESAHGVVFDNAYAHIGRSSNSLAAMLLSVYPKLDFREATEEPTGLTSTSLAALFHSKGYRTAFYTPSDLQWAGWNTFLADRGFDELHDSSSLPCSPISSWGVEDRCMIDAMIEAIERDPTQPLFLMGWTTQTHHPYEPTPGIPALSLLREQTPDDYNLERYLNVLHETDRHLGRLFDTVRRTGLADNTVIVVTGDHGQAFGYPHDSWMQGKTLYQEDVHVPLMLWSPRRFRTGTRSKSITSHVDLAPTVAELAGLPAAPEWQGRSLFDAVRVPRAYFYVAEDQFTLGIREDNWKYIFNLREGLDELYDLDQDPTEQQNLAKAMPERALELRRRLAAWTEANRRQYDRTVQRPSRGRRHPGERSFPRTAEAGLTASTSNVVLFLRGARVSCRGDAETGSAPGNHRPVPGDALGRLSGRSACRCPRSPGARASAAVDDAARCPRPGLGSIRPPTAARRRAPADRARRTRLRGRPERSRKVDAPADHQRRAAA